MGLVVVLFILFAIVVTILAVWWRFYTREATFKATHYTLDTLAPRDLTSKTGFLRWLMYVAVGIFLFLIFGFFCQALMDLFGNHPEGRRGYKPIKIVGFTFILAFYAAYFLRDNLSDPKD